MPQGAATMRPTGTQGKPEQGLIHFNLSGQSTGWDGEAEGTTPLHTSTINQLFSHPNADGIDSSGR